MSPLLDYKEQADFIRRNHKPRRKADRKRRTQLMIGAAVLSLVSFASGLYTASAIIGDHIRNEQLTLDRSNR